MLTAFFLRVFLIGTVTFGGGYAVISALQQELVMRRAWLTAEEFSNGVAAGQLTPGPLLLMITFMGYKIAGFWGALLGTIALFLPTALLVVALSPYYLKLKNAPLTRAALSAVNAAVVALLVSATLDLAGSTLASSMSVLIALFGAALMGPLKKDSALVLIAAGVIGELFLR
jgi:chromate transporter